MAVFDRKKVKFLPFRERKNKITLKDIWELDDKIPEYKNADLEILAETIVKARENDKPVIWMMGAHPLRRGNSRFIIDLMKRGMITHIAANMACAIHDFELAFMGATCENVEEYIKDGKFGNWEETGFYINAAAIDGFRSNFGLGEAIARMIYYGAFWSLEHSLEYKPFYLPNKDISIFRSAYELRIPITVHKGIGYDITDQHSSADFAALGWASGRDFLIFVDSVSKLEGGVFLNIGTQVMGPEVYLKALSMARNVASQAGKEIKNFTTAVFDIVDLGDWKNEPDIMNQRYYFRPLKTILIRAVKDGGKSFYIKGDFRMTVSALYHNILKEQKDGKKIESNR
jgi:hypothetical protein